MLQYFPYPLLNKFYIVKKINELASKNISFLFVIDFKGEEGYVISSAELDEHFVKFDFGDNQSELKSILKPTDNLENDNELFYWDIIPVSFDAYLQKFNFLQTQIRLGNSYLVNLTQPTKLHSNLSLLDLYKKGRAKYKLWLKDKFTVLSPETFIQIKHGKIAAFPMKGTIDASIPHAEDLILNDPKEKAEHATIVDLIRNDLNMVAEHVEVKRYRYLDRLSTNRIDLLQVSSEITGELPEDYLSYLGDIIFMLLPAGSICGAPKSKTVDIIESAENYEREFYTGICGWFDGENLDSAVMIRFVEQQGENLIFKSGGGITAMSDVVKEYNELIQKVYAPIY